MEEILNKKDPQNEAEIDLYKKVAVLGKSFFIVVKKRKNRDEIFVSGEVGKIIGWTEQQVIDQKGKLFSLIHRDDAVQIIKKNNDFISSKNTTTEFQYRILSHGKTEKWIKERVSVERNKKGSITSSLSLFTDVTEFYNQIIDLQKSENTLRETCEGKDKFINILSHDLPPE